MSRMVFGTFTVSSEHEKNCLLDFIKSNRNDLFYIGTDYVGAEGGNWQQSKKHLYEFGDYNDENNILCFEILNSLEDFNATDLLVGKMYHEDESGTWTENVPILSERLRILEDFFVLVMENFNINKITLYISSAGYEIRSEYKGVEISPNKFTEVILEEYQECNEHCSYAPTLRISITPIPSLGI